jgi:peptide/nickel transport system substrate-binding protein
VRSESYWGEPAKLDSVTIRSIPEASARIAALETGEVDMIGNVEPDLMSSVTSIDGIETQVTSSTFYYLTWFNFDREPFADARVRQALWHAVDLETIIPSLFGDSASVATAPISSVVFGAPELEPYTYDPDLSKKLLAEAGYPDGFSTTMIWPNDAGPNADELAQTLISAWAEIGVKIEPKSMERAQWTADFNAHEFDMNLFANSTATGDAHYTLGRLYTCAADRFGFCDPKVDELLAQAKASVDQDERADLYAQVSKILWDEAIGMFISELTLNLAYDDSVKDVELPSTGRVPFSKISISND